MIKSIKILAIALMLPAGMAFGQKLVDKTGKISIFSHTSVEDISADNYKVVSTINTETGDMIFVVPMQSFEFEKAMMQKHFNSKKHLDTQTYPKAKFKGKITDLSAVDFNKDGEYEVTVKGTMTMHGETKELTQKGKITIKGGKVTATTKMKLTLADYKVGYEKGKPSTNIAKTIDIDVHTEYTK